MHDAWYIIVDHGASYASLSIMMHDASIVHNDASCSIMMHDATPRNNQWILHRWCIMMDHDASWWIMMDHDWSWWIMDRLCIIYIMIDHVMMHDASMVPNDASRCIIIDHKAWCNTSQQQVNLASMVHHADHDGSWRIMDRLCIICIMIDHDAWCINGT